MLKLQIKQSDFLSLFTLLFHICIFVYLLTVNKHWFQLCNNNRVCLYNSIVSLNNILPCRIPFLIRRTVCCYGIAVGSDKEWNFAWEMYNQTDSVEEDEDILLYAMSCAKESWLLYRWPWSKYIFVYVEVNNKNKNTLLCKAGGSLPATEACVLSTTALKSFVREQVWKLGQTQINIKKHKENIYILYIKFPSAKTTCGSSGLKSCLHVGQPKS